MNNGNSTKAQRNALRERRAAAASVKQPTTPNPANLIRKVQRIRNELREICDGIDKFLEARASVRPAKDLFS